MNLVDENKVETKVDIVDLLKILIKEKITILVTFIIVFLIFCILAVQNKKNSKKATTVVTIDLEENKQPKLRKDGLLINDVLQKIYQKNSLEKEMGFGQFKSKFVIEDILPNSKKREKEKLEHDGKTLNYIPNNYVISLKLKNIEQSQKVLRDYCVALNENLKQKLDPNFRIEKMEIPKNIDDYESYLNIISEKEEMIEKKLEEEKEVDYGKYGFKYRNLKIELNNFKDLDIKVFREFLESRMIVKDIANFERTSQMKLSNLKNTLNTKLEEQKGYKRIIDEMKKQDDDIKITTGMRISKKSEVKSKYYIETINKYIKIQDEISSLTEEIKRLERKRQHFRVATDDENIFIKEKIRDITENYNKIVEMANNLEEQKNNIENGQVVRQVSPVEIVENSKYKLIILIGIVFGFIMGIIVGFIKNFIDKNFRKNIMVVLIVGMFFVSGTVESFATEKINIMFTYDEINYGKNPDGTVFDLKKQLKDDFLKNYFSNDKLKNLNIEIIPKIQGNSFQKAKQTIEIEEINSFIPAEYIVEINSDDKGIEENTANVIKKYFPNYYKMKFMKREFKLTSRDINKVGYFAKLKEAENTIQGYMDDIQNKIELLAENNSSDYKEMELEIWKLQNKEYMDLKNFLMARKIELFPERENSILQGEKNEIEIKKNVLESEIKLIKELSIGYVYRDNQAEIASNGEITLEDSNEEKEKQYVVLLNKNLDLEKELAMLNKRLDEINLINNQLRLPTEEEKKQVEDYFKNLEVQLELLNEKMTKLEMKNYEKHSRGEVIIK